MQKRASHWGAARQEDAHEFFTALLHGLSDEVQQAQVGGVTHHSLLVRVHQSEHVACMHACMLASTITGMGSGTSAMMMLQLMGAKHACPPCHGLPACMPVVSQHSKWAPGVSY